MRIPIAREGWIFIIPLGILTFLFAIAGAFYLSLIGLLLMAFSVIFFRDPGRVIPEINGSILSPADGRILRIEKEKDGSFKVHIFMSILNVHINRLPVRGMVESIGYHKGRFFNASLDKASEHNERNVILMRDEKDRRFTIIQIAGVIARRISCWIMEGRSYKQGERFGLIRFGSRVEIVIPSGHCILVKDGDKVRGGLTVLAREE